MTTVYTPNSYYFDLLDAYCTHLKQKQQEEIDRQNQAPERLNPNSLDFKLQQAFKKKAEQESEQRVVTPFDRMQHCRDALAVLDKKGWNRSFHQRQFHEDFLVSSFIGLSILFLYYTK